MAVQQYDPVFLLIEVVDSMRSGQGSCGEEMK